MQNFETLLQLLRIRIIIYRMQRYVSLELVRIVSTFFFARVKSLLCVRWELNHVIRKFLSNSRSDRVVLLCSRQFGRDTIFVSAIFIFFQVIIFCGRISMICDSIFAALFFVPISFWIYEVCVIGRKLNSSHRVFRSH